MSTHTDLAAENAELRAQLAEAEATLDAIRTGGVDALVVSGPAGEQVFALQGSETPYRRLMESMNEGAATIARDGTVLYCNRRFAEMAGLPPERVVGASLWQCVQSEQQPVLRELVGKSLPGGSKAEFELSCGSGPGVPVLLSLSPIELDSEGIAVVATDLSERKQHEEKLRRLNQELEEQVRQRTAELAHSQRLLQSVIETVPDPIYAKDAQSRLVLLNPAALRAVGKPADQVLGRDDREFYDDPAVAAAILENDRRVMASGVAQRFEEKLLTPEGYRDYVDTKAPWRDAQGKVIGIIGVSRDVTSRNQAEAALRDKEAELRAITEVTPVLLTRCSRDLRYLYANHAYAAMLGCTPEQVVGRPILEIMGESGFATIRPRVEQVLQGQPVEYEDQVYFALSGQTRWLHVNYVPDRDEQGNVRGWVASIADITKRKEAEEALRRIEQERQVAEAVRKERQRFQEVLNMLPAYVVLLSRDCRVPLANRFFEERFGTSGDRRRYEHLFNRREPCEDCQTFTAFATRAPHHWEWAGPDGRIYDVHDFPFTDVDGSSLIMEVGLDITERKQAETELGRHRERLQDVVRERTAELHAKNEELTRFNNAMVGRELRMIELKQEINALCVELGRPPAYACQAAPQQDSA